MNDKNDEAPTKYVKYETGLVWHPSGWVEITLYWSDGSVTVEKRPCKGVFVNTLNVYGNFV